MVFRATLRRGRADAERSLGVRFKRNGTVLSLLVTGDRRRSLSCALCERTWRSSTSS